MQYNPDTQHRRSIRLKDYDYRQSGAYFITICTYQRLWRFGSIENEVMTLNVWGEIVVECWQAIPQHYDQVELDAFVVMPNHLHGILLIDRPSITDQKREFSKPIAGSLSTIIGMFKAAVTRRINQLERLEGSAVWQRNFYEHIIRSEPELNKLRVYVENNPLTWAEDSLHEPEIV